MGTKNPSNHIKKRDSHLDDLDELIHPTVSWEYWLSEQQLSQNTARWPDVNVCRVVCGTKNELRGPIIPRADIRHIGFSTDQLFGTGELNQGKRKMWAKHEWAPRLNKCLSFSPLFYPWFLYRSKSIRLTCQSHTASGLQFQGPPAGFGAWCLCDTRPGNGCKPDCETTGTCTPEVEPHMIRSVW